MVNHIVLWNIKGDLSVQEKREAALTIKSKLQAVAQTVEGVISLEVVINEMESSNKDIALISKFESEKALEAYQVSPEHVEAGKYIKTVTEGRSCFDFCE